MITGTDEICVILGGGGHARVLVDSLRSMLLPLTLVVLDANRSLWGCSLLDVPILGDQSLLADLAERGAKYFVVGVGSIGNTGPRKRLFQMGLDHYLGPLTVIHSSAVVSPWAKVGGGSLLFPRSVVNPGARVGRNVIVNSGAIVEHDCVLEDHVHVATGAILAGTVTVGESAHIGCGAVVKEGITVGPAAIVGAGAVIIRDVGQGEVVAGVPARPVGHGIRQT